MAHTDTDQPSGSAINMPRGADQFERLAAHFDTHFELPPRGGSKALTYVTGEQVISRLNDVFGIFGWQFLIDKTELVVYNDNPFEFLAHGRIGILSDEERFDADGNVITPGVWVWRSQVGSQQVKYFTNKNGEIVPIDLGFDAKGAGTDCLKKAASLFGVALYLTDKEDPTPIEGVIVGPRGDRRTQTARQPARQAPPPAPRQQVTEQQPPPPRAAPALPPPATNGTPVCEVCGKALEPVVFEAGPNSAAKTWSVGDLVRFGQSKHKLTTCWEDYRKAKAGTLPPKHLWAAAAAAPATTKPAATNGAAAPAVLPSLRRSVARLIEAEFSEYRLELAPPAAQSELVQLLYEAVGEGAGELLVGILDQDLDVEPLNVAAKMAIEAWTNRDKQWVQRAEKALVEYQSSATRQ